MSHSRGGAGFRAARGGDRDMECTPECASPTHAGVILTSVALGNLRLLQHCSNLCSNAWRISDGFGRSPLHVAASRGHTHITEWLIARKKVAVDTVDKESGWSALHRSVYFGELGTAVSLVKLGAGLGVKDYDGLTPLSLINKDRLLMIRKPEVTGVDVYTWGSNANTTLGHAHSRPHPERLELPPHLSISQVVLEKFHSVLLTSSGLVLTCGHGRGGRLGHGTEASFVTPRLVGALKGVKCVSVATARNHTLFLTDCGVVYSCGLNDAHQLGLGSAPNSTPTQCLTPTPITAKNLRGRQITAIGAGRYHSALATESHVYTFGQNLGQLGYERNYHTQIIPKAVPQISVEGDDCIVSLSASHAATAVLTRRHRVFVCCDHIVKSLRCGFLEKLECVQFQLCAPLTDRAHLRGTSPEPTKILLLDSEHKLWYWEPGKKGTLPQLLPGLAQFNVAHFTLGKNLTIVTDEGEAYLSLAQSGQPLSFSRLPSIQNASSVFTDFKATNFAYLQTINSVLDLPSVAPPTLTSDLCGLLKEDNILDSVADITIQSGGEVVSAHHYIISRLSSLPLPSSTTLTLPPSPPHILTAFLHYLYGATVCLVPVPDESDSGSTLVPPSSSSLDVELTPDTSFASVDENDLTEMYDRFSSQSPPPMRNNEQGQPLENGFDEIELIPTDRFHNRVGQHSTPKKPNKRRRGRGEGVEEGGGEVVVEVMCASVRSDLQSLQRLAGDLHVSSLIQRLDDVLSNFSLKQATRRIVLTPPPLSLSPSLSPTLTDVTLLSSDHQTLSCHKCVLVARSDYFRSMLLMGWRETSEAASSLSLPFSSQLLATVVEFIYTDTAPSVSNSDSLEWIVQVLVTADQLLLTRLRDICELTLARKLTLRSVCEVAEVAAACSASQLKTACLQFIGANAAAMLEARLLDSLSPSLYSELSSVYKNIVPLTAKRTIRFPDPDPRDLPESYFQEGGGGEEGDILDDSSDIADTLNDHHLHSPPPNGPPTSSHAQSSGSRRRRRDGRRRKSSQSGGAGDPRRSRDSGGGRGSVSPSPTASPLPPSLSSPTSSPEENTSQQAGFNKDPPDKTQAGSKPVPGTGFSTPTDSKPVPETGFSTPKSAYSSHEKRQSRRKKTRKKLSESYRSREGEERNGEVGKVGRGNEDKAEGQEVKCERGPNEALTNGLLSPVVVGPSRKVWGEGESKPVCLKDIIAEEMATQYAPCRAHRVSPPPPSSPSPRSHPPSRQTSQDTPSHPQPTSRQASSDINSPSSLSHAPPRSLPASRQTSYSDLNSPPPLSSSLPRSPPENPWRTAPSPSPAPPVVSLRDLMAEETLRAQETKKKTRTHPPPFSSSSPHPSSHGPHPSSHGPHPPQRRRPSVPQSAQPPVSFADIILSQQRELDSHSGQARKPLSCIQIEQQAINQLEDLYRSRDNPDEYITVQRHHPKPSHAPSLHHSKNHTHAPPTTPWNAR